MMAFWTSIAIKIFMCDLSSLIYTIVFLNLKICWKAKAIIVDVYKLFQSNCGAKIRLDSACN